MRGVWVFRGLGFQGEKGRIEAEEECEVRSIGGGEVILSGRERERERVMVVATTSPPLIFLSLNFDLSLRFCSCKGRQRGELRDGDYS